MTAKTTVPPVALPSLDRQSGRRSDPAYLGELHGDAKARFCVLAGSRAAIVSSDDRKRAAVRWFAAPELSALGIATANALFLGVEPRGYAGHFAVILGDADAEPHAAALAPLVDLRSLITQGVLSQDGFSLLAQARMLAEWHASSRFCGRCGGGTRIHDGGWKVSCNSCGSEQFPRVDPVVIMLITKGVNCILAREPRFPEKMYSTLAGFVEPGEDVRSAVRRETREEIGVELGQIEFFGSQPWPFPHSLMIGCVAEAMSETLTVDKRELADGRWFGRSEVRDMLAGQHARGLFVPGGDAIAHALIRQWAEQA